MARIPRVILPLLILLSATGAVPAEEVFDLSSSIDVAENPEIPKFLAAISKETGATFAYDRSAPEIIRRRLRLTASVRIPRSRLFDWARAVLLQHGIVLVPSSRAKATVWNAMTAFAVGALSRPTFVPADEIEEWADRDGAHVATVLTAEYIRDSNRVRQTLAILSTRLVGRVTDVPGTREFVQRLPRGPRVHEVGGLRLFAVADYAPVVAVMKKVVRDLDLAAARVAREEAVEGLEAAVDPAERRERRATIARIDAFLEG